MWLSEDPEDWIWPHVSSIFNAQSWGFIWTSQTSETFQGLTALIVCPVPIYTDTDYEECEEKLFSYRQYYVHALFSPDSYRKVKAFFTQRKEWMQGELFNHAARVIRGCPSLWNWPANIVSLTDPHLGKAAGFIFSLIGAAGHDGLSPSLWTGHVAARAEQQLVGVLRRHAVEEPPQGLVAPRSVTQTRLGGGLDACWHVLGAQFLAHIVDVASFGCVQAAVHCCHTELRICGEFKWLSNLIFKTDRSDQICSVWSESAVDMQLVSDSYGWTKHDKIY